MAMGLIQDIRYAIRTLLNAPGFTLGATLTLALAIGANTAIFSAIDALLLHPYPFPEPSRIVVVSAVHARGDNSGAGYRDFLDWREQNTVFDEMAILPWIGAYTLTGEGEPQRINGGQPTAGFFRVLGIQPVLGRFFTPEEDKPGGPRVAVISYQSWQHRFGARPDILGQSMTLDGAPYTIIGVMPMRFAYPGLKTSEFWAPLGEDPGKGRFQHQYSVIARLKPGISITRAQAEMSAIAHRLEQQYPETNKDWHVEVSPLEGSLAAQIKTPVAILFSAVTFVLLLACANVAGLMLVRASGRAREIAIRISLGATRSRVARQMLTESVLLAVGAGALGILIAAWLMDVFRTAAPEDFALDATMHLDLTVLAFTLAVSILTGVAFGLATALYASKTDLNATLKSGGSATGTRSRNRFLSGLVAGEIALSLVLLAGAGLLVKDFLVVMQMKTGIRTEHVLTFALDLPSARYSSDTHITAFYQELLTRLRAAPGVDAAGAVGTLPMTGGFSGGPFEIEGRPKPADWMAVSAQYNSATPGYFRTMGMPLLRGRDFDERDTATAPLVVIIDETLARRYFPNEDPLGRKIKLADKWRTIAGIVGAVNSEQPMHPPVPQIYVPYAQPFGGAQWVTVRTAGDPAKLAANVVHLVQAVDRDVPVLRLRTMRQVVSDSLSEPRLMMSLLSAFAGFALVLAAIGIYGVIAYSVTQRLHEMGIRVALGATRVDLLRLVVGKGASLAVVGLAFGLPAGLAAARLIGSLLYGIKPTDATVFIGIPALLVAVALSASFLPARRAASVDPIVALRHE
jgi:putative ABC transport system permease protein